MKRRLNRLWRLLATALGFVMFGVFGVLFQIVLLPYLRHPERDTLARQKKRAAWSPAAGCGLPAI